MSFRNEQASDQPISADSTAATKADLKSPADCLSAGGGQLSDLQWQAFRYLTDELEAEEIAAFEKLLQESAAAGEALVAMVSLLEFLGQQSLGNEHCGQEPASHLKQSASVPRQAGGSLTPTGEITHLECGKTSHGSPAGGQRSWAWLAVAAVLSGVSLFGWWQLGSESRRDLAVAKSPDPSDPLGLATEWAEVWAGRAVLPEWEGFASEDERLLVENSGTRFRNAEVDQPWEAIESFESGEVAAANSGQEVSVEELSGESDWLYAALVSLEELEDWPAMGDEGGT